ncbi:pseudoazurin [Hoeflea marina]|uniref:Pseudoazurin n=1 Tax=Hoeflea marina TaxID=274592 RepID=A0A317PLV1_9HYPH|nr:pseudoazurin [Hoeflea marina]PWW00585.1 pseudoazurin [Hoeflea marina]
MRNFLPMASLLAASLCVAALFSGPVRAEDHEIRMLNSGAKGAMVFEPDFLRIAPGDSVRFVPTDKGHNVETVKGMMPEGAGAIKGKFNKEVLVTFDHDGVYGFKCAPHYAMGMVALVEVGTPVNLEEARAVKQTGKAKSRFAEAFATLDAAN